MDRHREITDAPRDNVDQIADQCNEAISGWDRTEIRRARFADAMIKIIAVGADGFVGDPLEALGQCVAIATESLNQDRYE